MVLKTCENLSPNSSLSDCMAFRTESASLPGIRMAIVGVALHAQNVVDIRLRDGHGKSGGRVALRFCDICDLLFLRGEQAQLVCLRYRRLRRFRFRRVIGQLYTSSLRMISSACAFRLFISPTHFI